jgi:hypothetical protein
MPDGTYRDYSILELLGAGYSQLQSAQGFGMPPIRIIEQRGPLQHGATLVDFRYQQRVLQVVVSKRLLSKIDLVDHRFDLVDLVRPSREFPAGGGTPSPLIYRKWVPGGKRVQGTDLVLTAGDDEVKSVTGRFVHYGLRVGSQFTISGSTGDDGDYTVAAVYHDGRIELDQNMSNTETGVHWEYTSEPSVRDLYCTLELGPAFDRPDNREMRGYIEALRFVGHDPFWYGAEQEQAWAVSSDEFDNLVFDYGDAGVGAEDAGAAFGATPGTGRWLFADNYVSDEISIPYWGHEGAVPIIEVTGPAEGLVARNGELGAQISFDYNIGAGQVVTIDTLNLTVEDNAGEDLFLYLTGDVSGFIISPDAANNRVNTIAVEFSSADANSAVNLVWRNRYTSV